MIKNIPLAAFIEATQFDMENLVLQGGCEFIKLTEGVNDDLYLVFTYKDEQGLVCKIAHNIDCLCYDYDIDWEMPVDSSGNVWDTEITDCAGDDPWDLADQILNITYEITHTLSEFTETLA